MKKGFVKAFLAVTVMSIGVVSFSGCSNEKNSGEEKAAVSAEATDNVVGATADDTEKKFTVTFYDADGTTVLNTVEVADGSTVEEYTPEKEGYIFAGWFGTPQLNHAYDFNTAITADTSIFAGFVSYVEDDREFAIVGSGTSDVLRESNWGAVIGDAQLLTRDNSEDKNVYTITLDLQEGDEFQFAQGSSWWYQRGYGYLDTIEKDGVQYFVNSGGIGDTAVKKSNIKVGVSGNYTFYLTTYPGEDTYDTEDENYTEDNKACFNFNQYDKITWTYNGECTSGTSEFVTDYFIKGAKITEWQDVYSDKTKFINNDGIYTLKVELEEGDEFLFTSLLTSDGEEAVGNEYVRYTNIAKDDNESLSYVTGTDSANMVATATGTYTFTYDPQTQVLTVAFE